MWTDWEQWEVGYISIGSGLLYTLIWSRAQVISTVMPQVLVALVPNVWYVTWPADSQPATPLCIALVLVSLRRHYRFLPQRPAGQFVAPLCNLLDWQARPFPYHLF